MTTDLEAGRGRAVEELAANGRRIWCMDWRDGDRSMQADGWIVGPRGTHVIMLTTRDGRVVESWDLFKPLTSSALVEETLDALTALTAAGVDLDAMNAETARLDALPEREDTGPGVLPTRTLWSFELVDNMAGYWSRRWFATQDEAEAARAALIASGDATPDSDMTGEFGDIGPVEEHNVELSGAGLLRFAQEYGGGAT